MAAKAHRQRRRFAWALLLRFSAWWSRIRRGHLLGSCGAEETVAGGECILGRHDLPLCPLMVAHSLDGFWPLSCCAKGIRSNWSKTCSISGQVCRTEQHQKGRALPQRSCDCKPFAACALAALADMLRGTAVIFRIFPRYAEIVAPALPGWIYVRSVASRKCIFTRLGSFGSCSWGPASMHRTFR